MSMLQFTSMTRTTTIYEKALEYLLVQGYSVIPVGSDKRPLISWKEYQQRLPTEEEVESWWGPGGSFVSDGVGIGIVTGKVSGITVIDIDVKGYPPEEITDRGVFPLTYTVQTKSGGYHLYYDYDGGEGVGGVKTGAEVSEKYPHVDIRNDGGYVVAPPTAGYEVIENCPLDVFPKELFAGRGKRKNHRSVVDAIKLSKGSRNDALASATGSILRGLPEEEWGTKGWNAVLAIAGTQTPPLPETEVESVFKSIMKAEKDTRTRKDELRSPIEFSDTEAISLKLRCTQNGVPYKDVENVIYILSNHTEWAGKIWYDSFTQQVMFDGREKKESDDVVVQSWLQKEMNFSNLPRGTVRDAIEYIADMNARSSALEYIKKLEWDGVPRVDHWVSRTYGVEDTEYHQQVGSNWLRAMVRRIVWPGSKFDHVLVLKGGQGVKKTTSFSVLGGPWHVETSADVGNKDFFMLLGGNAIIEFSEGETLTKAGTRELKSIITRQIDKYRAPYARSVQDHPRQCVFCMTTNDTEFLRDNTGNRRWWIVEMPDDTNADTAWLKENRDQLLAEAYVRRKEPVWKVPEEEAARLQEEARIGSSMEEEAMEWYRSLSKTKKEEGVSKKDFIEYLYNQKGKDAPVGDARLEYAVSEAFKGGLKLKGVLRRIDGIPKRVWVATPQTPWLAEIPRPLPDPDQF